MGNNYINLNMQPGRIHHGGILMRHISLLLECNHKEQTKNGLWVRSQGAKAANHKRLFHVDAKAGQDHLRRSRPFQ